MGYAGMIINLLAPLRGLDSFKRLSGGMRKRFMIDSPYWRSAVMIVIDDGRLGLEEVAKSPQGGFITMVAGCDAFVEIPMPLLMAFVMGRTGIVRMSLHLLSGRIKAKGVLQLIHLLRIFLAWRSGMSAMALRPGARIKPEE